MGAHPYDRVDLAQGTKAWLEWRRGGVGASDAPTIMGENPFQPRWQLLFEKRGQRKPEPMNDAMRRGSELEPVARQQFELKTGKKVAPACLQSREWTWLRASVDGISEDGTAIVEIKCGESAYKNTALKNCVSDYYYGQLQHIMAVTGVQLMDYWCYLPGRTGMLLAVQRDQRYIDKLLSAEAEFWADVVDFV